MNVSTIGTLGLTISAAVGVALLGAPMHAQTAVQPQTMPQIGQVDPRFVSFNIEAVEVAGGRFWKPFPKENAAQELNLSTTTSKGAPTTSTDPYEYRPPINLGNQKLRKLAAALGPSYLRVSGTWMNSMFFQNDDAPALATPPQGFKGVLTRAEWKGVVDFSRTVDADLVTSAAISDGTRDAEGNWTPDQTKTLFDYTKSIGGRIAAAEFMNEPTFAGVGGAPKGYDAAAFARDAKLFRSFLRAESPGTVYLGPGSIGEGVPMVQGMPIPKMISSEDMLKDAGPVFDAFSYHFYTTLSTRCVGKAALSWEKVLTPEYLNRNAEAEAYYAKLRDVYLAGKPIWNTETGEAGCGGNRWASDFVDSFRFIDQLGVLAQKTVQTVIVNTLAASDYGLLDPATFDPRPNFWAALLWKRIMGTRVLNPMIPSTADLRIYAQCAKESRGAVALVVLNLDRDNAQSLQVPLAGTRFTLSATQLLSNTISLNSVVLRAHKDGSLPNITGARFEPGTVRVAPATITFIVFPSAKNSSCM